MENPRFVEGMLDTGFIDRETGLPNDIKRILEQGYSLEKRLPKALFEKKKIAAISAVAAVTRMWR